MRSRQSSSALHYRTSSPREAGIQSHLLAAEQFSDILNQQFYCTNDCHAYPPWGLACSEYFKPLKYHKPLPRSEYFSTLHFLHVQHSTRLYKQLVATVAHR